jgi:hypothetical protein
LNKSPFTNVLPNATPKAKFKRHQVHEVIDNLSDARHIGRDYALATRYTHRMLVTIAASPNIRPYDPIYLDGLLNGLSGYWTVLEVQHLFNSPQANYTMKLLVGADVLGDVNPNAGEASQLRNLNDSLINQNITESASTLLDTSFSTPVDAANTSSLSLITSDVVAPVGMFMISSTPTTELVSTPTPDFSIVKRPVSWQSPTQTTLTTTPTASAMPSTSATATVPTLTSVSAVVNTGTTYNAGTVTVTVAPQTTGGSDITLYTVTTTPTTSTFTSTTSTVTVTGLSSNTSYVFKGKATNAVGNSTILSSSNTLVTTTPQAPTIGAATKINGTTVTVAYTAGNTGGSAITGYTVVSSPSVSGLIVTGGSGILSVSGAFAKNTSYTFTVAAVNANGTGAYSGSSNAVTGLGSSSMTNAKVYFMKG